MFRKPFFAGLLLAIALAGCRSFGENASSANSSADAASPPNAPRLGWPADCQPGKDCHILKYVDIDPSDRILDSGCGTLSSDGHKGTDFSLSDERRMEAGVDVLAAAKGRVLRVRDEVEDRRIASEADVAAVKDKECGNGVVIDLGNGWETQYCHLKQGSIIVRPGDPVKKGQPLGQIGLSGLTEFPHVHFSLTYEGQIVDPFIGRPGVTRCMEAQSSLWEKPLAYEPTGLLNIGFASRELDADSIWRGELQEETISADAPVLIFWSFVFGVRPGDRATFRLIDPQGNAAAEIDGELTETKQTWLQYVGKRNTAEKPLVPGRWKGEYRLQRGDRVLIDWQGSVRVE